MRLCDRECSTLDGTKTTDDGEPDLRQLSSAALSSALLRVQYRLAKQRIHFLDEIPGALVGHAHLSRAGRDRAERSNLLEQFDFSRPDVTFRAELDANAQSWHGRPLSKNLSP